MIYVINLILTYGSPTVRLFYVELGNQALKWSQKIFLQTAQSWPQLYILSTWCNVSLSSICTKLVRFVKTYTTWYLQTCCKLLKQRTLSLCKESWQSTCSGLVIVKPEEAMWTHPDIGLTPCTICAFHSKYSFKSKSLMHCHSL